MKIRPFFLVLNTLGLLTCTNIKATAQTQGSLPNKPVEPSAAGDAFRSSFQWTSGAGANGHLYLLTSIASNWTAAEAQAVAMGGHLVSINSANEENFLISTFLADASPVSTKPLWIGLTDTLNGAGSKAYTTWTSGEAVAPYTNWNDPSEPNNLNNSEDYVAFNWHYSFGETGVKGTWDDLPLNGSTVDYGGNNSRALGPYQGIVEIVPEPATNALLGVGMVLGLGWLWRRRVGKLA